MCTIKRPQKGGSTDVWGGENPSMPPYREAPENNLLLSAAYAEGKATSTTEVKGISIQFAQLLWLLQDGHMPLVIP